MAMAAISTHLDLKPYQVAVATDPTLPMRKWNWHRGTMWAVSAKSAAYEVNKSGDIAIDPKFPSAFKFPDGQYVCAGFGIF